MSFYDVNKKHLGRGCRIWNRYRKVKVGSDHEMEQSERNSYSKNRGGIKLN